MTGHFSSVNSCGRVSAWCSVRTKPGASMAQPLSTMPTRPFSTVPVWARSFQQVYSTTFSMGRTVCTPYNSRDIPAHLNGKNVIQCTSPTIRTAPPKMWQTLSACSHPCRVVYLATSPHPSNGKERRSAGTAGSNNKNYKNYPHGFPTSFSQRKANARSVALKRKSCLSVAKSPFK